MKCTLQNRTNEQIQQNMEWVKQTNENGNLLESTDYNIAQCDNSGGTW